MADDVERNPHRNCTCGGAAVVIYRGVAVTEVNAYKEAPKMHKAMYERIYSKPYELDSIDSELLEKRKEARKLLTGPLVGDFVITPKGLLRFTHDWGDSIQTTVRPGYDQSFYVGADGYMSFSGSLDSGVSKADLTLTDEIRDGSCWFFSHGYAEAHNGVDVTVPCRVYRLAGC